MKTKYLLFIIFLFCFENSFSQGGTWTWISGDSITGTAGVYGTQGVPSVNNHPPSNYEYCEWKDKQGNFWIYGGTWNNYSDLWKYNPVTNEWTWVKGSGLTYQPAHFGTKGISDPANTPGIKGYCVATWVDTTGNFWLLGNFLPANDLWRYDISSNEWTWINGDSIANPFGVHGVQGVPSSSNVPGGRHETCSTWTDSLNNLWLFGGDGFDDAGTQGDLNDVMKYDISTNEWTWMYGSALSGALINYGTKGVSSPTNDPGARMTYTKWKDAQENFWIMGGQGLGPLLNDIWKFDKAVNEWTWMAGSNVPNDTGIYQATCVCDTFNPSSRFEQRASVTDNKGRFWMFGGYSTLMAKSVNDLWVFDPTQLKFIWVSGTNIPWQSGNYGTLGVPSATNIPPSRAGSVAWWGNDNKFYMYAGGKDGLGARYNDLWVFNPDSICIESCLPLPVAGFQAANPICPGTCTDFTNLSLNATSYQWSFPGASPDTSTDLSPTNICYAAPGNYNVQLIAYNANGNDTLFLPNYITVYPVPPPQSILQSGDTLFAIAGSTSYQWYFDGNILNGATNYFYIAQASGDYNVVVTDSNGCEVEAAIFDVVAEIITLSNSNLMVFPNPANETLYIENFSSNLNSSQGFFLEAQIAIFNVLGECIYTADGNLPLTIDCRLLTPGIYMLEITSDNKRTFRTTFNKSTELR